MKTERETSQKKIILNYLIGVKNHPSAEEIYIKVKKSLPSLSRGTVYRILKNLKEKKIIQEIPSSISRYDGDTSSHAHFICNKCDKIFDIFNACKDCKIIKNKKTKVGKINNYQVYFYGKCKFCEK